MRLGDGGFTLIEAILVVTLLAILAAAVLIKNPIEKVRVNGAAAKVKADIRYARKLAVSSGQTAVMRFDATGYGIFTDLVANTPASGTGEACSTDASGNFNVDFSAARCANLNGILLTYSTGTVAFDALGTPLDAAGTPFAAQQTVTVAGTGGSRLIQIEAQTGRVSD
jgi:prepilin-type N-terminal cleavage/methylation domain-containing protein